MALCGHVFEQDILNIIFQEKGLESMKSMRKSEGERYKADNPERVHPSDMENRELLEVYSSYAKVSYYTPEESEYVGQLRLEMLKRMGG